MSLGRGERQIIPRGDLVRRLAVGQVARDRLKGRIALVGFDQTIAVRPVFLGQRLSDRLMGFGHRRHLGVGFGMGGQTARVKAGPVPGGLIPRAQERPGFFP